MRGPRKKAKEQSIKDQILLKKASLSLNMKLLPETETDGKMASLLRLKSSSTSEEKEAKLRENITEESIFTAQWDIFTNFISINMIHKLPMIQTRSLWQIRDSFSYIYTNGIVFFKALRNMKFL